MIKKRPHRVSFSTTPYKRLNYTFPTITPLKKDTFPIIKQLTTQASLIQFIQFNTLQWIPRRLTAHFVRFFIAQIHKIDDAVF